MPRKKKSSDKTTEIETILRRHQESGLIGNTGIGYAGILRKRGPYEYLHNESYDKSEEHRPEWQLPRTYPCLVIAFTRKPSAKELHIIQKELKDIPVFYKY